MNRGKRERKDPRARPLKFGLMPFSEEEYSDEFRRAIQIYSISSDDDDDDDDQQQQQQTAHVFGHDDHVAAESWNIMNTRVSDVGFGFDSDNMVQQLIDEYNLPDFSPHHYPFQLLDSQMVQQQDLEMDSDDINWESFLLDYGAGDSNKVT